ncbi:MAG: hypothetical protein F6J87_15375 [Spirulina sp. SIO3F2]|nr:hypothetical protein [Spirulina sp. SIO3F2]
MKFVSVLTAALLISPALSASAQADAPGTAAAFVEQYENDLSAIPLPSCAERSTELTRNEIQLIVLAHNQARKDADTHVPSGTPALPAVSWDCAAAEVAQQWADETEGRQGHSANNWRQQQYGDRTGLSGRAAGLGENLGWSAASSPDSVDPVVSTVLSWDAERSHYNHSSGACNKVCGHYTQIIWRESTKIGCGLKRDNIQFPGIGKVWEHGYFLSCTYHNVGNINGDNPLIQHPDWYYQ